METVPHFRKVSLLWEGGSVSLFKRRLLRVPWIAGRANSSVLKEINPEYSWEGLVLKLQYFGHLMWNLTHWKRPWCWERLKAGEGDDRGRDGWLTSLTQWTWVWANSWRWWRAGKPGVLQSMEFQRVGRDWTASVSLRHVTARTLNSLCNRSKARGAHSVEIMGTLWARGSRPRCIL